MGSTRTKAFAAAAVQILAPFAIGMIVLVCHLIGVPIDGMSCATTSPHDLMQCGSCSACLDRLTALSPEMMLAGSILRVALGLQSLLASSKASGSAFASTAFPLSAARGALH